MKLNFKLTSSVVVLFIVCACVQAVSLPKTSKLVPPETVLLLDIENFSQLETQFSKTRIYKFYKDPVMAGFFADVKKKWGKKIEKMDENNILKTLMDSDVIPTGRVAFALVLNERTKDANQMPMTFITQWGENITKIKEGLDRLAEKNVELGGHQKASENFQGIAIETAIDEKSIPFSYCFVDDCFIGSADIETLKFIIAHIKGASSPALDGDGDYTSTLRPLGPGHDIDFYVNIKHLIKSLVVEDSTGQAQTYIGNLGLDNVTGLGCSIGLARKPASSFSGKGLLKINGSKKGILKMLQPQKAAINAPKFIPLSAYSISFLNLDIKKGYAELGTILNSFNPMFASVMYMPLIPQSPEGKPALMLKEDIIDHFGSQIVAAQDIKKPFSSDSSGLEYIFSLGINNRNALEKSFLRLFKEKIAPNNAEAMRQYLGHTIYIVKMNFLPLLSGGGLQAMQGPGEQATKTTMPNGAFTLTDTHLIFGLESAVEKAIRTLKSNQSITSAQWYNSAKSLVPSSVGAASLEDIKAAAEFFWWSMKQAGKSENKAKDGISAGITMAPTPGFMFSQSGLFDATLLPEFSAVSKYFGLSASYLNSREDGFFLEFRDLNPATN